MDPTAESRARARAQSSPPTRPRLLSDQTFQTLLQDTICNLHSVALAIPQIQTPTRTTLEPQFPTPSQLQPQSQQTYLSVLQRISQNVAQVQLTVAETLPQIQTPTRTAPEPQLPTSSQLQPQHQQTYLSVLQRISQNAAQVQLAVAEALSQIQTPTRTALEPQFPTPHQLQPQYQQTYLSVLQRISQNIAQVQLVVAQALPQIQTPTPPKPQFLTPPQRQPQFKPKFDQTSQTSCHPDHICLHNSRETRNSHMKLISRIYCQESDEESLEIEYVTSLTCYVSEEVNNLHEALKNALKSEFVKFSPALGRRVTYFKESRIRILPRSLIIKFVPWDLRNSESNKLKVDYPLEMDVYDFCSDDLLNLLRAKRRIQMSVEVSGIYDLATVSNFKPSTGTYGWRKLGRNGKWGDWNGLTADQHSQEIDDITSVLGQDDWLVPNTIAYIAREYMLGRGDLD